jgi:hypothetical protein
MLMPWAASDLRAVIDETCELIADSGGSIPWVLGNHDVARVVGRLGLDQTLIRNPSDALWCLCLFFTKGNPTVSIMLPGVGSQIWINASTPRDGNLYSGTLSISN